MGINDVMSGAGHGMLSLLGLGQLYDPIGDLRSKLSSSIQRQSQMVSAESLAVASATNETIKNMYVFQGLMRDRLQKSIDLNQSMVWNSLQQENFFISVLSVLVIIIIFFMLIQKKCC